MSKWQFWAYSLRLYRSAQTIAISWLKCTTRLSKWAKPQSAISNEALCPILQSSKVPLKICSFNCWWLDLLLIIRARLVKLLGCLGAVTLHLNDATWSWSSSMYAYSLKLYREPWPWFNLCSSKLKLSKAIFTSMGSCPESYLIRKLCSLGLLPKDLQLVYGLIFRRRLWCKTRKTCQCCLIATRRVMVASNATLIKTSCFIEFCRLSLINRPLPIQTDS